MKYVWLLGMEKKIWKRCIPKQEFLFVVPAYSFTRSKLFRET